MCHFFQPQCSAKAVEDWEGGDIRLVEDPVPRGKGPRQHHFSQSRHKAEPPEQTEDVVELEIVVQSICPEPERQIEQTVLIIINLLGKDALAVRNCVIVSRLTRLVHIRTHGPSLIPAGPAVLLRPGGGKVDGGQHEPGHHHRLQQERDQGEEQAAEDAAHSLETQRYV